MPTVSSGCYKQNNIDWVARATNVHFSQFWRLGSPRSRCRPIWLLVRALLVCRWQPSCCVLTWWRDRSCFSCLFKNNFVIKFNFKNLDIIDMSYYISFMSLFLKNYLFIFWLCWDFVAAHRLSRGLLFGACRAQASHCGGFSCCGARALGPRASVVVALGLSSCGSQALEHRLSSFGAWA